MTFFISMVVYARAGEAKETSPFTHTPLSRGTYPAVAGYLQRGSVVTGKIKERWWKGVFYWNFTKKSYRLSVSERLSFLRIR